MSGFTNKKMEKSTIVRIVLVSIILLLDLLLLPWIIQFPSFLLKNISTAPSEWFNFGWLRSVKLIFTDYRFRQVFLFLQIPVGALIVAIAWNVDRLKKKNRIRDGVGGPEPAGEGQFGTSRWQTKKEMDKTCNVWDTNDSIKKGGIVFGMEKSSPTKEKVWYNNDDLHTLIIGATRSGKSRKVIIPSIWEIAKAGESMIVGDPKGELYITCRDYLKEQGYNVITLNLREPLKGNQWNILDMVNKAVDEGNIPKATEYAWSIANTISNQTPSTSSEPIWKNGEQSTLAALMLLSALDSQFKFQRHMATAYYLLAEYGQPLDDESIPLLDYIKSLPVKHPAKAAFATASIAPYKTRASFFTTALSDLKLFSDPTLADMTSKQDHDLEKIGIDKTAVFLIVPDEDKTRHVLATLYIDQVYQSMVSLANKRGGRIPRRVNMIIDEFGNLPPIPDFDAKLTVAGGRGVRFCIAVQDVTQLKKLYEKNAQTITGNCHNWIYIKTYDVETAKLISEKTGKYTVETDNFGVSVQQKGHSRSHGTATTGRALLMPDEVLRWDVGESLILSNYFPARYSLPDLSLWNANEELGLVMTGNIDADKEANRQIIERRWAETPERELEETQIWLPEIITDDDEDEPIVTKVNQPEKKIENVISQPAEEVAATLTDLSSYISESDKAEVANDEFSMDSILKNSSIDEDTEGDNFL
jgi:type IV secretion system protein VirD4